ncbi:DUF4249 domain-containing protein [Fibrella aquatilis]|uniref:DUF4249 domain-containing protein n=1 Tax=Fibrella aquatilis TaxID=2817059 RepID=A0A939G877_9BACT|nr:DUF4249 domain-containing protein [Fibrella aquatilis]MBO0931952.1 DUF4249 domain-containing protein [Fibrella aquatilis]
MKNSIFLVASLFALSSCEKVITLDLKGENKRVVIEGGISNEAGPYSVRVSQSADFYQAGVGEAITNATVTLSDNTGATESLTYTSNGTYQTKTTKGTAGRTYTLRVTANGATYQATSTMPAPVPLESLTYEAQALGDIIYANYTDPIATGNAYRWVMYVNDKQQGDVFAVNDRLNNGIRTRQALFLTSPNAPDLKTGDRIRVDMQCIDAPTYEYFFGLAQVLGSGNNQAATPANPTSNLSGGALGYFSAYSITSNSLTIK